MERYSTTAGRQHIEKEPDAIVKVAYGNFVARTAPDVRA